MMQMKNPAKHSSDIPYKERKRRHWEEPEPASALQDQGGKFLHILKAVSKEYCLESSICGLKRLVETDRSVYERAVWVVVMMVSLACSASLVILTFQQFNSAPLVTTQLPEGMPVSSIVFPAVSVCTTNRISKASAARLASTLVDGGQSGKRNKSEMMELLLTLGRLYDLEVTNTSDLRDLHSILEDRDIRDLLRELTPQCDDILRSCIWEAKRVNCSDIFEFRLTMNGFCCTFNYLRDSDEFVDGSERTIDMYNHGNKSQFGYDMGLRVLLRLDRHDDFYSNVPLLGAQLTITDAYDFPDAQSGSLRLQMMTPERQTTVFLSASVTEASRDIQHVPIELRGCLFYDESPYLPLYTNSDCLLKCRVLFMLDVCDCTPFNVPKMAGVRTCSLQDVPCLQNYTAQSITVQPLTDIFPPELELDLAGGGIPCPMCYPTCSKTVVSLVSETVRLYPEFLNEVPDSEREPWLRGVNFSEHAIFHIKYADEMASAYGQNIVMKWFDLVSNIGSTCGFVTGFSFVSLFEFLYFFTFRLFRAAGAPSPPPPPPPAPTRPLYWGELARGETTISNKNTLTITGAYSSYKP